MIITSLKKSGEIITIVPTFWPKVITLEGYQALFVKYQFSTAIINSLVVAVIVSVCSVAIGFLAAYSLARVKFRSRAVCLRAILYAYLMPKAVLFIPLYMLVTTLGIANKLSSLILIYPTFTIPYVAWMLVAYLKSIPISLEEAAIIDGCSRFQSMLRVVLPLSLPGLVSTLIISVTLCWNEYLYAMVMIHDKAAKTIPLVISEMIVADVFAWGPLMAAATVASVPVLIIYLLASKNMVTGLTAGGVKG
jgi:multiple sugar transport system permease protein